MFFQTIIKILKRSSPFAQFWYNSSPSPCFRTSYTCTLARVLSAHHSFTGLQNFRPRARHARLYTLLWVGPRREGPSRLKAKRKAGPAIQGPKFKARRWHSEGAQELGTLDARRLKNQQLWTNSLKCPVFCRNFTHSENRTGELINSLISHRITGQVYFKYYIKSENSINSS